MTAKEMFKKMRYKKYCDKNKYPIIYAKNYQTEDEESITFTYSCMNTPLIFIKTPYVTNSYTFDKDMIGAIQKQIKELEW